MENLRITIFLFLILLACDAPYWIDEPIAIGESSEPVVISIISPDSIPKVFLYITNSDERTYNEWINQLESATVSIEANDEIIPMVLNPDYRLDSQYGPPYASGFNSASPMFIPENDLIRITDGTYTVKASIPGFDNIIQGSSEIPDQISTTFIEIDNFHTLIETRTNSQFIQANEGDDPELVIFGWTYEYSGKLKLLINDPENLGDLYNLSMINKTSIGLQLGGDFSINLPFDPVYQFYTQDRDIGIPRYFDYGGDFSFSDAVFNGEQKELEIEFMTSIYVSAEIGDTTYYYPDLINLQVVSEDFYAYIRSGKAQRTQQQLPFSEPVPVYSNMSNRVGITAGYRTIFSYEQTINTNKKSLFQLLNERGLNE